jgi:hypothetical protein
MNVLHTKLKDIILKTILNHASSSSGIYGNARHGAQHLFDFIKKQISEEIYVLYLNKCQDEFFKEYQFENGEPFVKGLMEARYFIIRMFHISFCEYFKSMDNHLSPKSANENKTGRQDKISA